MVFFNYSTMQMAAKVVYYGPGLCGKTTNLQYIYSHTSNDSRGEMVSLETETDRTLFFDLLPLEVGKIQGFKTRIQLYTVPGQVFYNTTRKLVLKGVDGIVFVADSQRAMLQANAESLENLKTNLAEIGLTLDTVPMVLQYNKRDLSDICTVEELDEALNQDHQWQSFESSAITGEGVFATLKGISKLTLLRLKDRLQKNSGETEAVARKAPAPSPEAAPEPTVDVVDTPAEPAAAAAPEPAPPAPAPPQPPAEPAPAPAAARGTDREEVATGGEQGAGRRGDVDILAELEKIRQQARGGPAGGQEQTTAGATPDTVADSGALPPLEDGSSSEMDLDPLAAPRVNGNGRREIDHSFHFRPARETLVRADRLTFSLRIEDEHRSVVDTFDEEIQVGDSDSLEHLLLRLRIALDPTASGPND